MWVNRALFNTILADNKTQAEFSQRLLNTCHILQGKYDEVSTQKAKDDMTIDWMRHRINALEKERVVLLNRAAGIVLPTPEIVPTTPRTYAGMGRLDQPASYDFLPNFEDVGDVRAQELGLKHDDAGNLEFAGQTKAE